MKRLISAGMLPVCFGLVLFTQCLSVMAADLPDREKFLGLARVAIQQARYATLITLDDRQQPRARIVDPFVPDDEFVIWIATKPLTRKVSQIAENNRVTLFYWDQAERNTVALMGTAELVQDVKTKLTMRRPVDSDKLYPDFPDDYLLIKFTPKRIEALLPGYRGDKVSWEPTGIDF